MNVSQRKYEFPTRAPICWIRVAIYLAIPAAWAGVLVWGALSYFYGV